jgi:tRNA A-37 threonylcarbamoyl transferase component Bud32
VPNACTLFDMDLTKVDVDRREKWICQLNETIAALHKIGITWSDVKANNVLINSVTDDAWLIDFGGGGTDMWTEFKEVGKIEGDLATAHKLDDYLRLGEQYRLTKELRASD